MEQYMDNKLSDITYQSEFTPHPKIVVLKATIGAG